MIDNHKLAPFRFREVAGSTLITNETGQFHLYDRKIIERLFDKSISDEEVRALRDQSVLIAPEEEWKYFSLLSQIKKNVARESARLNYLIVIPTLRCDLSCSYCQVSRADINAKGYDWDSETIERFRSFLAKHGSNGMKIEFQGGEPSLRPDLIQTVVDIADELFENVEFVICTNLTNITEEFGKVISNEKISLSTSIDGPKSSMTLNRTSSDVISDNVLDNVKKIIKEFGHSKISALPTITEDQIDAPEKLIDHYRDIGFNTIFLRPVNYQGFARKSFKELSHAINRWNGFYSAAMQYILELSKSTYFEEFYTGELVRKIFADKSSGFVDYKSPAKYAQNYCVIDFDGKIYPTDESRMLSRTRQVDLCIGDLETGLNKEKIDDLNQSAIHHVHEDCIHCAYMPFCGIDIIDDMSRYARFDLPKNSTWFCNRHIFLFDFIFEKVINWETDWLKLFNSWIMQSRQNSEALEVFR